MKKQTETAVYDNMLNQLIALDTFISSAHRDMKKLYEDEDYKVWSKLSDERHKLYLANNLIVKSVAEEKIKRGEWEEETGEHLCNLMFYQAYNQAKKIESLPILYQVHLEKIDINEKKYIVNQYEIDELNKKIQPYESFIKDLFAKIEKHDVILEYLLQQRSNLLFSYNVDTLRKPLKISIVKERLKSYSSAKTTFDRISENMDRIKAQKDLQCVLHSYVLDDMPKPPEGSKISDPTGDAFVKMLDMYEKILTDGQRSLEFAQKILGWVELVLLQLNDEEKRVIDLFYFKKYSWAKITTITNFAERTCHYKHDSAIEKMIAII